ncbi:hypothetical protein CW613_004100 [Vibrio mimicus]
MRVIKIAVVTALAITIMLIVFFVYQYAVAENQRFTNGIEESGLAIIYYLLVVVFFFVIGLVGFLPSFISIFTGKTLANKMLPMSISIVSIAISIGTVYYFMEPLIAQLRSG